MLEELSKVQKVIGIKQSHKALRENSASNAYFADNADPALIDPLKELCDELGIPYTNVESMQTLGQACGIDVGAAVVVVLRDGE